MSWDYRSTILLNKKIKIKRYLLNDKNAYFFNFFIYMLKIFCIIFNIKNNYFLFNYYNYIN